MTKQAVYQTCPSPSFYPFPLLPLNPQDLQCPYSVFVVLQERIDGVNVKSLSERYLSLTKDQTVSTELTIEGGIHAKRNVISNSPVEVAGLVSFTARIAPLRPALLHGDSN